MKLISWLTDILDEKSIPAVSKMGQFSKNFISDVADILDLTVITEFFVLQNWVLIIFKDFEKLVNQFQLPYLQSYKPPWGAAINCKFFPLKALI